MVIALQSYKKMLNYDLLAQAFNCFKSRKILQNSKVFRKSNSLCDVTK